MRSLASRLGIALLAAGALTAPLLTAVTSERDTPVEADHQLVLERRPTNAAKVFRWGNEAWHDEFEVGGLHRRWTTNARQHIRVWNGMLKLEAADGVGMLWAKPTDIAKRYGRWEARIKTRYYASGKQLTAFWELIPAGRYRCGAKNITLASYTPGSDRVVTGSVRTLPNNEFGFSVDPEATTEEWHTYAVEITPERISWLVDTKVMRTEKRPAALSGVTYVPRFRLTGGDASRNETWLNMDWVRYYTLARPNAKPVTAPQMNAGTYAGAC